MDIPFYQVDAFTDRAFAGNPAAVCPLETWLDDAVLQSIAAENNLSETAFFVGANGDYQLRWFTPACEVDLCGHATLASAHIIFSHAEPNADDVRFHTRSGALVVRRDGDRLVMNFPSRAAKPAMVPQGLAKALGVQPLELRQSTDDWMVVVADEEAVRGLTPDMRTLSTFAFRGLIVTAKGEGETDFVSRFFAPGVGVDEDPVTGSAHCVLAPYWAKRLRKEALNARQLSARGGAIGCRVLDDERVELSGTAVQVIQGTMTL